MLFETVLGVPVVGRGELAADTKKKKSSTLVYACETEAECGSKTTCDPSGGKTGRMNGQRDFQ
jgi:hypothetical protein